MCQRETVAAPVHLFFGDRPPQAIDDCGRVVVDLLDRAVEVFSRVQIGVTDRYIGQFYPLLDIIGADRIRTFGIAEFRMVGDLLFGRR